MNLTQTAQLLAMATTFDRVTRTEDEVRAWQLALANVPFDEAAVALPTHFADPVYGTEFLKPAHLTRQIAATRPSVTLPPRALEVVGECDVHPGYPVTTTTPCAACTRHPGDRHIFETTGCRPELVSLPSLTVGRTPEDAA